MLKQPKGVFISEAEQGSEDWHNSRLGKFTASRAGDLMLKQRNGQPYATRKNYIAEIALERITGKRKETIVSEAMQNGIDNERVSALAFSFTTGLETEQTGFWYKDYYGASPDDLVENGGVEYKNPQPATHRDTLKSQEIPEYYYWQIIQNMLVTAADVWYYVSHNADFPPNAEIFIKKLNRKDVEQDIKALKEELEKANQEVNQEVEFIKNYKGEIK